MTLALTSVPDFVLALLLVGVVFLRLGWLPPGWGPTTSGGGTRSCSCCR
ncbi:hypothetical protein [Streptomyces yatensis]|nr:hypothetical protein [Streptomyces yatensis]